MREGTSETSAHVVRAATELVETTPERLLTSYSTAFIPFTISKGNSDSDSNLKAPVLKKSPSKPIFSSHITKSPDSVNSSPTLKNSNKQAASESASGALKSNSQTGLKPTHSSSQILLSSGLNNERRNQRAAAFSQQVSDSELSRPSRSQQIPAPTFNPLMDDASMMNLDLQEDLQDQGIAKKMLGLLLPSKEESRNGNETSRDERSESSTASLKESTSPKCLSPVGFLSRSHSRQLTSQPPRPTSEFVKSTSQPILQESRRPVSEGAGMEKKETAGVEEKKELVQDKKVSVEEKGTINVTENQDANSSLAPVVPKSKSASHIQNRVPKPQRAVLNSTLPPVTALVNPDIPCEAVIMGVEERTETFQGYKQSNASFFMTYVIFVQSAQNKWIIYRRFSQFEDLRNAIKKHFNCKPPFCEKKVNDYVHKCDQDLAIARANGLNAFLLYITTDKFIFKHKKVQLFLTPMQLGDQRTVDKPEVKTLVKPKDHP